MGRSSQSSSELDLFAVGEQSGGGLEARGDHLLEAQLSAELEALSDEESCLHRAALKDGRVRLDGKAHGNPALVTSFAEQLGGLRGEFPRLVVVAP